MSIGTFFQDFMIIKLQSQKLMDHNKLIKSGTNVTNTYTYYVIENINSLPTGYTFALFFACVLPLFFKTNFFEKFLAEVCWFFKITFFENFFQE